MSLSKMSMRSLAWTYQMEIPYSLRTLHIKLSLLIINRQDMRICYPNSLNVWMNTWFKKVTIQPTNSR
jgi:hypothetical protein